MWYRHPPCSGVRIAPDWSLLGAGLMPTSLHGYAPDLARLLGLSPAAVYERQKALARAGLLMAREGRGPGSGVRADVRGIALLLISVLATDSLTEAKQRAGEIASAQLSKGSEGDSQINIHCPNFITALEYLIETDPRISRDYLEVMEISVSRRSSEARMSLRRLFDEFEIEFGTASPHEPLIDVRATLSRKGFSEIRALAQRAISTGGTQ